MSVSKATIAEVQRREAGLSWYDFRREYREGVLSAAHYKGDPEHPSSYRIEGSTVTYGDGFKVELPAGVLAVQFPES